MPPDASSIETRYSWVRLVVSITLSTLGCVGLWSLVVALPAVQADFGVNRGGASLPYTLTMIGFGFGGILMGRLADRFGVFVPVIVGGVSLGAGFIAAGLAPGLLQFTLVHGVLIGLLGCSATFAPLVADTALWFNRHRGIAVAICASGNYLAGTVWPPILQHFFETVGWRTTYVGVGVFCAVSIVALAFLLRPRPPALEANPLTGRSEARPALPLGLSPNALMVLLSVAGVACCVAMSMPQVHIVA